MLFLCFEMHTIWSQFAYINCFEDDLDEVDKIFVLKGAYMLLMKMKSCQEEECKGI